MINDRQGKTGQDSGRESDDFSGGKRIRSIRL